MESAHKITLFVYKKNGDKVFLLFLIPSMQKQSDFLISGTEFVGLGKKLNF